MKKILALTLALLMVAFALVSCSKYDPKFGKAFRPQNSQLDVLLQLNAESIDVGIMDSVMAGYYMSQDTEYANSLMIVDGLVLATEQYGIAARKGSGFAKKINAALIELAKEGKVDEIATKYGLASEICIDQNATVAEMTDEEKADWDYIVGRGKFVVGYTIFAPIAYKDEAGNLVGFEIELAKAVAAKLGLGEPEFKIIDWNTKETELQSGTIDCIWNGMTITEERQANMAVSIPYMNNKQVAVIRKADADKYKTTADMVDAIVGAEDGSAGMDCAIIKKEDK